MQHSRTNELKIKLQDTEMDTPNKSAPLEPSLEIQSIIAKARAAENLAKAATIIDLGLTYSDALYLAPTPRAQVIVTALYIRLDRNMRTAKWHHWGRLARAVVSGNKTLDQALLECNAATRSTLIETLVEFCLSAKCLPFEIKEPRFSNYLDQFLANYSAGLRIASYE